MLRKSQHTIASKIPVSYLPPPIHRHTPLRQEESGSCRAPWGNEGCCHLVGIYHAEKTGFLPTATKKILPQISKCGDTHLREMKKEKLSLGPAFWGSTWSIYQLAQPHLDPMFVWQDALGGRATLQKPPDAFFAPVLGARTPDMFPLWYAWAGVHAYGYKNDEGWHSSSPPLQKSCSFLGSRARRTHFLLFQLITKAFITRGLLQLVLK